MNMPFRLPKTLFLAGAVALAFSMPLKAGYTPNDPLFSLQWQWDPAQNGINITPAWDKGNTGAGVVIGILDTWVDIKNPELSAHYSTELSRDFSESLDTSEYPYPNESHGTFVAGCAAAAGNNGIGGLGAAFNATIAGLHVTSGNSDFSDVAMLSAFEWKSGLTTAGKYETDAAIHIKNCSFGDGPTSRYTISETDAALRTLIEQGSRNNVIYVFASGNDRNNNVSVDGELPNADSNGSALQSSESVIVVGATRNEALVDGHLYSEFSNYGSNLFVCAPGSNVVSTARVQDPAESASSETGDSGVSSSLSPYYTTDSGTSFSTPIISGVIALAAQSNLAMDTRWAKWAFANTSVAIDDFINPISNVNNGGWVRNSAGLKFSNNYGFGLADADAFVEYSKNIAYETIRTSQTRSAGGKSVWAHGERYVPTFRLTTDDVGSQRIESVELTFTVSNINFYNDLKITIVDPNGVENIVLDKSIMSNAEGNALYAAYIEANPAGLTWTVTSNAFWGTGVSVAAGTWSVIFENMSGENATAASVGAVSLKFNMGNIAMEESSMSVGTGEQINVHALVLDKSSTRFSIASSGMLQVEDSVIMNAGTLVVSGTIGSYISAEWDKGAKLYVNGADSNVRVTRGGTMNLKRGVDVSAGTVEISGGTITGAGDFNIYGGTVNVTGNFQSTISQGIKIFGGTLNSSQSGGLSAPSVYMTGGTFNAGGTNTLTVTTNGGSLVITGTTANPTTISGSVVVGATETTNGYMSIAAGKKLISSGGVSVAGLYVAEEKDSDGNVTTAEKNNLSYASIAGTVDAPFAVGRNGVADVSGGTFTQNFSTSKGSVVSISGQTNVNGATGISFAGTVYANAGSKISSPIVALDEGALLYVGGSGIGTTQIKTNQFTSTNATIAVSIGDKIEFTDSTAPTVNIGAGTVIQMSFLDDLPTGHVRFLVNPGSLTIDPTTAITTPGDIPTVWTGTADEALRYHIALADIASEGVMKGDLVANVANIEPIRLTYSDMTEQQVAIVSALRTCLDDSSATNRGVSADLIAEINRLTTKSALQATYEQFKPVNLVMINEMNRKQANAITGAVDRRTRELRNGFPRSDLWSEPLFNSYGFSFSANPNMLASSGFREFAGYELDTPALFWANGGYAMSESKASGTGLKTNSNMLNVAFGIDYAVLEQLSVGIFGSYSDGKTEYDYSSSENKSNMRTIGIYLAGTRNDRIGSFYYTGMASYGMASYNFKRTVEVGSYSSDASSSPDGSQIIGYIAGGYEWDLGIPARGITWSMGPQVSLRYVRNSVDSYDENGSGINALSVDNFNYDSLVSSLGWRIAYRLNIRDTMTLLPELRASWKHEFLDSSETIDSTFIMSPGSRFSTEMNKPGEDYAEVGVGITLVVLDNLNLSLDYDAQLFRADSKPDHSFNLMMRCRF